MSHCQELRGIVVHGQQLGRQLGFPTANLDPAQLEGQLPQSGVYAALATLEDGRTYCAMVNVGYRPTVDTTHTRISVEAHLDEFEGNLYGQSIHLSLKERIRDEKRMESLEQLKKQLAIDLQNVKNYMLLNRKIGCSAVQHIK